MREIYFTMEGEKMRCSRIRKKILQSRLMHDFRCKRPEDMYYKPLQERSKELKEVTEEGEIHMSKRFEEFTNKFILRGKEEGKIEGKNEGKIEDVVEMLKDHLPIETVAKYTRLSLEQIVAIGKQQALL